MVMLSGGEAFPLASMCTGPSLMGLAQRLLKSVGRLPLTLVEFRSALMTRAKVA